MMNAPSEKWTEENIYQYVGEFGIYQVLVLCALSISTIPPSIQEFITIFLTLNPSWQCLQNTTANSSCDNRCALSRSDWVYSEEKKYSIVTEFDLSCNKENLIYVTTSVYFASYAVGALVLGYFSDRYGRKKVIIISSSAVVLFSFINAFTPTFVWYTVCRIVIGFFVPGTYVTMVVMATELVGERYRPLAATTIWFFFFIAEIILGLKAMFVRQWRLLLMICSAPYVIIIPILWFVPESFAWLNSVGRHTEASVNIARMAKINRKAIDSIQLASVVGSSGKREVEQTNPLHLFKTIRIAMKTITIAIAWMSISLAYYGVSLAVENLTGNTYRDFMLLAAVEFPAVIATIIISSRYGRKKAVIIPLFLCGLTFVGLAFIPEDTKKSGLLNMRLFLGVAGKFLSSLSFDAIYIWCAELYPTYLRQEAAGLFNSSAYIGNIMAPWVALWSRSIHDVVPFLFMGSAAVLSSLSLLQFPDTKGENLPKSFENLDRRTDVMTSKRLHENANELSLGDDSVSRL